MKTMTFEGRGVDTVAINNGVKWVYILSDDTIVNIKRRNSIMFSVAVKRVNGWWYVSLIQSDRNDAKGLQELTTIVKKESLSYSDLLTVQMPDCWEIDTELI